MAAAYPQEERERNAEQERYDRIDRENVNGAALAHAAMVHNGTGCTPMTVVAMARVFAEFIRGS